MKRKSPTVFRPRAGSGSNAAAKVPTIGPATLAKFDGVQLLLLARITRARREVDSRGIWIAGVP